MMARMRAMSPMKGLSSSYGLVLTLLLATVLHPASAVEYKVTNTVPNSPGGTRFNQVIGAAYARTVLQNAADYCRGTAFSLSTPKQIATVELIVDNSQGVAVTSGSTIYLSASYVQEFEPGQPNVLKKEITGVLYHESTHIWQNGQNGDAGDKFFRGVIEGIADWVRLRSGFGAAHWTRQRGGNWWDGYDRTAFFLDWIQRQRKPNFVNLLNRKMGNAQWSNDFFLQIVGKSVDQLWVEYQNSI